MKRMIWIFVIAFVMLLLSFLVPRGYELIAPNIVRSDFGWPLHSLSLYGAQPIQNALRVLFLKARLSGLAVNFGTLLSYFLYVLFLKALCVRADRTARQDSKYSIYYKSPGGHV